MDGFAIDAPPRPRDAGARRQAVAGWGSRPRRARALRDELARRGARKPVRGGHAPERGAAAGARRFAEGLTRIPGIEVDLKTVQTNTVVFRVTDSRFNVPEFIEITRGFGLHISEFKHGRMRAVFHYGIETADVEEALRIISHVMQEPSDAHLRFQVQAHS